MSTTGFIRGSSLALFSRPLVRPHFSIQILESHASPLKPPDSSASVHSDHSHFFSQKERRLASCSSSSSRVAGFNRSVSFAGSFKPQRSSEKSYHARSISLPCQSHPFISQLEDEIRSVNSWQSTQPEPEPESTSTYASSAWLCDGLSRLELLHTSLSDLLTLPQNQDSLRRGAGSEWTDRVLDGFLRFADAHGCFRSEILALNEHQSEAQVAIRRKETMKLATCIRSMKKTEKQLVKLPSSLREISRSLIATRLTEEAELAGVIREVINVTVAASATVFLAISSLSSAMSAAMASSSTAKSSWMRLKKKKAEVHTSSAAMERLQELEECIGAVESKSERVFRCFVNTRVLLLTVSTPSL